MSTFVGGLSRDTSRDSPDTTAPRTFTFDPGAETERVEHFAVASHSNGLVLEVNGTYYDLDTQLAIGLVRLQRQATGINPNL